MLGVTVRPAAIVTRVLVIPDHVAVKDALLLRLDALTLVEVMALEIAVATVVATFITSVHPLDAEILVAIVELAATVLTKLLTNDTEVEATSPQDMVITPVILPTRLTKPDNSTEDTLV